MPASPWKSLYKRIGAATRLGAGIGLATLATPVFAQGADPAELVVVNGKVTASTAPATFVEAFAVKDGKFVAVGTDEEVRALVGPETKVIDAGGRLVIPGLNDSHMHPTRQGRSYLAELRWEGIPTLEEALSRLREQAERTPDGQWVRVLGGWSEFQFKERRLPTVDEINEATGDVPTFILHLYSRGFLNKAGLKALGIDASTPDIKGASYERDADGNPTGLILADPDPTLLYQTIGGLPAFSLEEEQLSSRHWYAELNRLGLTSVIDAAGGGHPFPAGYKASEGLAENGDLSVRVNYFIFPLEPGHEAEGYREMLQGRMPKPASDPAKDSLVLDGGGELLVYGSLDWENFMAPRPELNEEQFGPELTRTISELVTNGYSFRMHASYDESINQLLDSVEAVNKETPFAGRIRWAIDHAETVTEPTLERIKALGGGVAVQDRLAFAGEHFLDRYGADVAAHAPPLRKMLDMGIPVGLGTDGTRVASYNPWVSLHWAITGKTVGGTQLAAPENRLTREEALNLYTVGSAWFSAEETIKGAIAPDQLADFAILDADYFEVPEDQIPEIAASLTSVGGKVVYADESFAQFAPPALPPLPDWSPVNHFPKP